LKKERKKERLREILDKTNVRYSENKRGEYSVFGLHLEGEPKDTFKKFTWVLNRKKDKKWCEDFIDELLNWDGYKSETEMCYNSTDEYNADIVEMVAILAGYRTNKYENHDSERSPNYNNCFKISFTEKDVSLRRSH